MGINMYPESNTCTKWMSNYMRRMMNNMRKKDDFLLKLYMNENLNDNSAF